MTAPPSARASSFARRCPRRPPSKACGGCALKASDCKDRAAGPQRSGIRMDVSDRCAPGKMRSRASTSLAPGGFSPEYSMDWPKLRSSTAHCRNCIATSGGSCCERAGGNLKQKATSQWLPARALMARTSAAMSRRRSIALPRVAAVPLDILVNFRCARRSSLVEQLVFMANSGSK